MNTTGEKVDPHSGYLDPWFRIGVRPDSVQVLDGTLSHCGRPPALLVWLYFGMRSRLAPSEERLERGFVALEVAVPSSRSHHRDR
jgi:hypothetical protein